MSEWNGHYCEPERYPTALGQTWTCPECEQFHEAFDVRADTRMSESLLRHIPKGTLGWRTPITTDGSTT